MDQRLTLFVPILLLLTSMLAACRGEIPSAPVIPPAAVEEAIAPTGNLTGDCIEAYDASIDYFPDKVTFNEAAGINIEYHNHYKVINITNPWRDAGVAFQYLLVQCGAPAPDGFEAGLIIEVPVQTVVAMATTQLPHLDELGELDRLVGVDSFQYVNTSSVRQKIEAGELVEIGFGATVNVEAALDLNPNLVMSYAMGLPDSDAHPLLLEAGIPTVLNAAYMEVSPLGRAEWIKFTAAFFNKEARANEIFAAQQSRYNELAALTAGVAERPTVFTGIVRGNTWRVAGGGSYFAQYLVDAGANYLWAADESTGSIPLDFELVFERAADADYWLNTSTWQSLAEVLAADERYAEFAAFQNGRIYNNNARLNENGGNDYWETGVTHPELVLADLIKIFHPDLLPDHEFIFYHPLQ